MKTLALSLLTLIAVAALPSAAAADDAAATPVPTLARRSEVQQLGLGVILGDPIGGTAKLWFDDHLAADVGAGFASAEDRAALWADGLYHDWRILPQPPQGRLGAYAGAGPELETGTDPRFGLRTVIGLSYLPKDAPLEFFAEAGPLFRFTQGGAVDAVGGIGVRFQLPKR
jgi:hypothetical protein